MVEFPVRDAVAEKAVVGGECVDSVVWSRCVVLSADDVRFDWGWDPAVVVRLCSRGDVDKWGAVPFVASVVLLASVGT